MREFLDKVFKYKDNFKAIKITRSLEYDVQNQALRILKLDNINKLRDKHEGVMFYNNFSKEVLGAYALGKHLGVNLVDLTSPISKNFIAEINLNNTKVLVSIFNYGEFPLVDMSSILPTIFMIRRNQEMFYVCGLALPKIITENTFAPTTYSPMNSKREYFYGFDKLIPFSNIDELEQICETISNK